MRSNRKCSCATLRSDTRRASSQRGQVVVEFALALILLLVAISLLYQGLHFERDAFNRLLVLRQRAFHEIHQNQSDTEKTFFTVTQEFKTIGDLPSMPFLKTDSSLHWGPKVFHVRKGTRYHEPFPFDSTFLHDWYWIAGEMEFTELDQDSWRWRRFYGDNPIQHAYIIGGYVDPWDQ